MYRAENWLFCRVGNVRLPSQLNQAHYDHLAMPTVMRLGPYRFFFFSNEGREPPHIHVKAGSVEAKFCLSPLEIAANYGFNIRQLNNIQAVIAENLDDLMEAWNEHLSQ
jgi:hypothetical protein